jgi:hypothetical protein
MPYVQRDDAGKIVAHYARPQIGFAEEWVDSVAEMPELVVEKLKAELDAIERAEIMLRKTREIQIQLMEFLAVQQGITPEQLAMNPAYTDMKEIDAQCVALRQQIRDLS